MNGRRDFIKSMVGFGAAVGLSPGAYARKPAKRPNVVLIMADDLGYADVGYHGSRIMETPNIDSIAESGVQFSDGYVTAPVCGPTRAGLRSGFYQQRFGAEDNPGPYKRAEDVRIGIPPEMKTIAERMRGLGYATGMIGKSHTGKSAIMHPNSSGYEYFFGFVNGASNYRPDGRFGTDINQAHNPIMRNRKKVLVDEYLTDVFGKEAAAFVDRHKDEPFFLYVPFNAVHGPMQAKDEDLERFAHIKDKKRRVVAAMNYNMDLNVGRILKVLEEHELEENTLVFFLSDNGGKPKGNGSLNDPLRGRKGQLWDGGVRVPFCMQWPAKVPSGQKIDIPVSSLDILPTVVAAAGKDVENDVDGVSLLPLVTGRTDSLQDRNLYWRFNGRWAVRNKDWKLIKERGCKQPHLYHIAEDIDESEEVSEQYPEIARRMQKAYEDWSAELMPKLWGWDKSFPVHDPSIGAGE